MISNFLAVEGIVYYVPFPKSLSKNSGKFNYVQKAYLFNDETVNTVKGQVTEIYKGLLSRLYKKHL